MLRLRLNGKLHFHHAAVQKFLNGPKVLAEKVLPKIMKEEVAPILERDLIRKLPDSKKHPSGDSRQGQTAAVRARFPNKLNKQVRQKQKGDLYGVLQMVGVKVPEGNVVNFDFGKKAIEGGGRRHFFWGVYKRMRVNDRDIPKEIMLRRKRQIERIIADGINRAIKEGKFYA